MTRRTVALMLVLLAGTGAAGEPEIYRCAQDDGTVAFQQMPCRPAAAPQPGDAGRSESDEDAVDVPARTKADTTSTMAPPVPETGPLGDTMSDAQREQSVPLSSDRAECEKSARDAIDAIDAELQASSDTADDRARLDELLQLTRQLRECQQR